MTGNLEAQCGFVAAAVAGALMLLGGFSAAAQQAGQQSGSPPSQLAQPDAAAPPPVAMPSPAPQHRPGALEAFGRWMDESVAGMNRRLGDMWQGAARSGSDAAKASTDATSGLAKGAADAVKGTAEAIGRLGTGRLASGREHCTIAANGAPDCRAAAEQLCRSKGMGGGNSVEFETVERCSPQVLLRGKKQPGECPVEHAVTRAVCQ